MSERIVVADYLAFMSRGVFELHNLPSVQARSDTLSTSPSSILVAYIIGNLSAMTTPTAGGSWPLYISYLPDVKQNAGAVYDTTGVKDGRFMSGQVTIHHGLQLRIKSKGYEEGWAKIDNIAAGLDQILNNVVTVGANDYEIQNITRATPIAFLGMDEEGGRFYNFSINLLMTVKQVVI